jgi:PAS domain S-box-containing protein
MEDSRTNIIAMQCRSAGEEHARSTDSSSGADSQQRPRKLKRELTSRNESAESLRSSQAVIKALLHTPLDAVFVLDAGGMVLDLNDAGARRLGNPHADIIHKNIWDFLPQHIAEYRKEHVEKVFATGNPARFEDERQGVWNDTIVYPIQNSAGRVSCVVVVAHDITERKQVEGELRRSKKLLENAQRMASVGNWDVDLDPKRVQWSDELYRILGYTPGEIEPSVDFFASHVHPDDRGQFLNRSTQHGIGDYNLLGTHTEYRVVARDGSFKWVFGTTEAEYDEQGAISGISGTIQDITERRLMEEALRENEQKFRGLFLASGEGIMLCDSRWRIIGWNKALEHITGRPENDFLNRDACDMIIEFFPQEYRTPELHAMLKERLALFLSDRDSVSGEFVMFRHDGSFRTISYSIYKIPIGTDCLFGGILRDITDIQRAEEQSQRLGRIVEESLNEIYILDARTFRFILANRGARENLGYSMQELSAMTLLEMNPEFTLQAITARVEPLLTGAQQLMQFETMLMRQNGSTYPVEVRLHMAKYDDADVLVANVLDCTQRKLAEVAIRKSEERFRAIFNNAGIGIGLVDMDGRYVQVNSCWADMLGYSVEELLGMLHFDVMHPQDRETTMRRVDEMHDGSINSYYVERRFVRKDGTVFWVNGAATPLPDGQGGIEAIIGLAADITDRKIAEAERELLIVELTDALAQIKTLKGLLPICSSCKKIRDDSGYWNTLEKYIMEHSEAEFTHGICPDCIRKYFPEACEDAECNDET